MRAIRIGILPRTQYRERVLAIARGEYKPGRDEPKIWFESLRAAAEVLSEKNRALLETLARERPDSITALAKLVGRAPSNVSRTLATMAKHGFVQLVEHGRTRKARALATDFVIHAPSLEYFKASRGRRPMRRSGRRHPVRAASKASKARPSAVREGDR
jgi:predicted transcriptional regulator